MSSTVNTLWLFIILTNTALPSTITVFEARAVAWRTCIADMPRASTSPLFSVHVCQLPGRVIAHIHVYKSAGTVIKAMITAACALLKGTYTKLRELRSQRALQQFELLVVDDTRPKVLFSTHREPVRRFFSALAEVTRRGRMSAQAYKHADEHRNPLQTMQWMLEHQKEARLPQCNGHFAPAVAFLAQNRSQDGSHVAWPLDYVVDPAQPGELELLWSIMVNGSNLPYPAVDGRHHQDAEYQQCRDRARSCKFASNRTRSLMPYLMMEAHESTAWMNATLRQTLYRDDERCYRAAEQAALRARHGWQLPGRDG